MNLNATASNPASPETGTCIEKCIPANKNNRIPAIFKLTIKVPGVVRVGNKVANYNYNENKQY